MLTSITDARRPPKATGSPDSLGPGATESSHPGPAAAARAGARLVHSVLHAGAVRHCPIGHVARQRLGGEEGSPALRNWAVSSDAVTTAVCRRSTTFSGTPRHGPAWAGDSSFGRRTHRATSCLRGRRTCVSEPPGPREEIARLLASVGERWLPAVLGHSAAVARRFDRFGLRSARSMLPAPTTTSRQSSMSGTSSPPLAEVEAAIRSDEWIRGALGGGDLLDSAPANGGPALSENPRSPGFGCCGRPPWPPRTPAGRCSSG